MNKVIQKIVSFTQTKYMRILTNAFMAVAAISICGAIFSLIKSIPITPYQTFLTNSGLGDILSIPVSICSDLMALYVVLAMGYTLGKEFKQNAFACAVVALGAFMLLTPFTATVYSADYTSVSIVSDVVPVSSLGAQGIFLAILAGLLASRLYVFFLQKGWKIKMPDSVPDAVSDMFAMMIPGGLVFIIFLIIRWGFSLTSFGTAQKFIYSLLQTPIQAVAGGLAGALIYVTVAKFLWVFGVHGGMVTYSALATVIGTASAANAAAFAAGTAAPYPEWAWAMLMMDFGVLPLTLVLLVFARSKQYRLLAKISLPTSLFNISEPLVFGLPVIMNPIIAVPFVLVQPIDLLLTVLVTRIGLVAQATGASMSMQIPTIIQTALINSHWSGVVWAAFLIVLDCVIYYPFVRVLDKKACIEEAEREAEGQAAEAAAAGSAVQTAEV